MFFQHQASQKISAFIQKSSFLAAPGGEIQLLCFVDTTFAGFFFTAELNSRHPAAFQRERGPALQPALLFLCLG